MKHKSILLILIILCSLVFFGCKGQETNTPKEMTSEEIEEKATQSQEQLEEEENSE